MWKIITSETDRKGKTGDIFCFNSGNDGYDYQDISDSFKNIFLSIAVKINLSIKLVIIIINTKIQIPYVIYHNYLVIHYQI